MHFLVQGTNVAVFRQPPVASLSVAVEPQPKAAFFVIQFGWDGGGVGECVFQAFHPVAMVDLGIGDRQFVALGKNIVGSGPCRMGPPAGDPGGQVVGAHRAGDAVSLREIAAEAEQ